jgi:arylsulfatase A-like enzyme
MYDDKGWDDPKTKCRAYGGSDAPKRTYAAMITFMDTQVGRLLNTLKELGIDNNTIVFFTSDNGTTFIKGLVDFDFFKSVGKLKGLKGSLYEGGIREPMIVRWPGHVKPGTTTDMVAALYDIPATLADIAGVTDKIGKTDGISLLPTILGHPDKQKQHEFLFWDFAGYGGQIAVRMGKWKGIIRNIKKKPNAKLELYDLEKDVSEKHNVADDHPEIVAKIKEIIKRERTMPEEPTFRFGKYGECP